jgi:hypothetical protein
MILAIESVDCVIVGIILLIIITIAISVQKRSMVTEANHWNNYFKTHYR